MKHFLCGRRTIIIGIYSDITFLKSKLELKQPVPIKKYIKQIHKALGKN